MEIVKVVEGFVCDRWSRLKISLFRFALSYNASNKLIKLLTVDTP